jgi:hypothetical protein
MQAGRLSVVILYRHPLFGEGIAHLLAGEPGLDVTSVPYDDELARVRSLTNEPQVVIFERGDPDTAVEILRFAPAALVIDVDLNPGPAYTYHREEIQSRPDGIVHAIRRISKPDIAVAAGT